MCNGTNVWGAGVTIRSVTAAFAKINAIMLLCASKKAWDLGTKRDLTSKSYSWFHPIHCSYNMHESIYTLESHIKPNKEWVEENPHRLSVLILWIAYRKIKINRTVNNASTTIMTRKEPICRERVVRSDKQVLRNTYAYCCRRNVNATNATAF